VNEADIVERLRQGGLRLAFDTNALVADQKFTDLCNDVSRWNVRLEAVGRPIVQLIVCTVAHVEKLFDLKQRFKGTFDMDVILAKLESKGVQVEPFSAAHALEVAVRLGRSYPDGQAWHQAKKERCLGCVGLPLTTPAPGTGGSCGATVDWLIGGHAHASGCILVTDDKGPEFKGIERVGIDRLVAALQQLVGKPA
jgi:hypothetical protein